MQSEREALLARAMALDTELHKQHQRNGYQLGKDDVEALDSLIQRALHEGSPDGLRQFMAIRTAYQVHGKVSFEQMKLLKEVSDVFSSYRL
jgi:hypothetical protein